jgi:IS1 family transposase
MNKLSTEQRVRVIRNLVEGMGVNATTRVTGVAKNTVLKLLRDLGSACEKYQAEHVRDLHCQRVQCDEIWQFCYSKQRSVPEQYRDGFGFGDVWTWVGIDADTKLIVAWHIGTRDADAAQIFMQRVARRITTRIQLTTDGYIPYLYAVTKAFGVGFVRDPIDYAMLVKMYGKGPGKDTETRYSPAVCLGAERRAVRGNPDPEHISTSYVERQNLTMRMHMRRYTRLTNAHSKKLANHRYATALHFVWYNFVKVHSSLGKTPAIAAGIESRAWTMEDLIAISN